MSANTLWQIARRLTSASRRSEPRRIQKIPWNLELPSIESSAFEACTCCEKASVRLGELLDIQPISPIAATPNAGQERVGVRLRELLDIQPIIPHAPSPNAGQELTQWINMSGAIDNRSTSQGSVSIHNPTADSHDHCLFCAGPCFEIDSQMCGSCLRTFEQLI